MPRSFAVEPDCSNGKKQLSIAHFLTRRPSSDAVHSPKRHCAAPVSPHGRLSPRAVHSPASPRSSPLPHTSRASPRGLVQQSSSPNTAGFRSPRTVNVDREGPPQPSPRGTGAGSSIVRALPRKNTVQSSSNSDDKIRTPRGRPLDYNMQMILVREVHSTAATRLKRLLTPCRIQSLSSWTSCSLLKLLIWDVMNLAKMTARSFMLV
jgi:hypothetical protein